MIPCKFDPNLVLVSSTDFFTPVSQNPYNQGRIAIANALSDLYAVGTINIDSVLMILTVSTMIPQDERNIVTAEMIRGFNDGCALAGTRCTGGQTVFNPWPLLGGTASSIMRVSDVIQPGNLQSGDVMVLTKPLGTQIVGNLALWMLDDHRWSEVVSKRIDEETARRAVIVGEESMMRLNRKAAEGMRPHGAHGCTDVTGFGILGHASNLAAVQRANIDIEITHLPIIKGLLALEKGVTIDYRLSRGYSAETSGGLLIGFPADRVEGFLSYMKSVGEPDVWVVGRVVQGSKKARILPPEELVVIDV